MRKGSREPRAPPPLPRRSSSGSSPLLLTPPSPLNPLRLCSPGIQTHPYAGEGGLSRHPRLRAGAGASPLRGRRLAYRALWRGLRLRARGTRLTAGLRLSDAEGRERPAGRPKEREARSKRELTASLRGSSASPFLCAPLRFCCAGHRAAAAPSLVRTEVFPAAAFAAGRARPVSSVSRPAGEAALRGGRKRACGRAGGSVGPTGEVGPVGPTQGCERLF